MTGKKKFLTLATTLIASVSLGVGVVAINGANNSKQLFVSQGTDEYVTVFDSNNVPTDGLGDNYSEMVNGTIRTVKGNTYKLQFTRAKKLAGGFAQLAGGGKIYNYGTYGHAFSGLIAIQVTFTGTLELKTAQFGQNGVGAVLNNKFTLTSGTKQSFAPTDYFQLEAGDGGAEIQSISLFYSCKAAPKDLNNYNGTYTGYTDAGTRFELVLNNGAASIKAPSLSLELNGTATLNGDRATCVFPFEYASGQFTDITYVTDIKDYGRKFEFVSKNDTIGGAAASQIAAIDFYRVYEIQDFNNYSGTGVGYDQGNKNLYNNTGLRKDYACNWGSTGQGNDYIGGTAMGGDLDYLTYNATEGIDGTGVGIFKGNASTCRYYSMNSKLQVAEAIGKGTTFSFWAKSAKSTRNYTGDGKEATMVVRVYEGINFSSSYKEREFKILKDSDWGEYKMELDPSKIYYGYGLFCKTQGAYLPIDNISIYTEQAEKTQFAESATKFTKSYHASLNYTDPDPVNGGPKDAKAKIGLGANGMINGYCTTDMKLTSYEVSGNQITIHSSDSLFGDWVGTLSENNTKITIQKANISGGIKNLINTDTIEFVEDTVLFDGHEGTSNLQAALVRRWGVWESSAWKWTTDTTNTDRFKQNTTKFIQGGNSVSIRAYKDGAVRFYINPTVAEAYNVAFESIGFWYYVPRNVNYKFSVFSTSSYDPLGEGVKLNYLFEKEFNTKPSNYECGWHYINYGVPNFKEEPGEGELGRQKNFLIEISKTSATTFFDYITVF